MIKTLKRTFAQDKERFVTPRCVQDAIPIRCVWEDGIFLVGYNHANLGRFAAFFSKLRGRGKAHAQKYTKTFKFQDINYSVASHEEKRVVFLDYSELINSLDSGATAKISIVNRHINRETFQAEMLIPEMGDGMDCYRREYNKILLDKATGANAIIQYKYITISVCKSSVEEARS